ncbi:hypothetical protein B296_00041972 [Ensete ventricosum]|uniref:Uncharacterized protein n=1 Tax=Ensete ventricosum TaxID=4639 RepID=A0A426YQQ4_ENSVE|nr:hypothetical protein B296_00041972 [Ensete ventricosum]
MTVAAGAIGSSGCNRSAGQRARLEEDSNRRLRMAGACVYYDREGNVRWPTIGAGATAAVGNHLATTKAATWEAVMTEATTRWVRLEATCGGGGCGGGGGYGREAVESTGSVRNNFSPHAGFHRCGSRRGINHICATGADPTEEQQEKDQTMPRDWCQSCWFRRQRRQRIGAVGSGCRHQMAVVGSGEEEEHSLGCWHRSVGSTVE